MNRRTTALVPLILLMFVACTRQPTPETAKQEAAPAISDPTPPDPPNSVEVQAAGLQNMPAFMVLAIGGIADEGEKEGIEVHENLRLFRTDAGAQEIVSFYARELKDRGWTTDNQVARSAKVGLTMTEYRRAGTDALYVIISEPEDLQSSDATKSKRHVALLPAKVTRPKR